MNRFENKVAVVTGGASGIGRAITDRLISEGAKGVVVVGRNAETNAEVARAHGDRVRIVQGDVRDLETHREAADAAAEAYGKIDVYVPNAALARSRLLEAVEEADFDETMDSDFKAVLFGVQITAPHMNDGGAIVLVSSIAGLKGMPGLVVYSGAKAAIRQLARSLAVELGPRGIRTNVLTPGTVETPALGKLGMPRDAFEEAMKPIIESAPLRRMAKATEMASIAAFLASDDASYITGAEIVADGGVTAA